jgi:hypothetical protein
MRNDENEFEILRGVPAIARAIGETERRVYSLLESRILPGQKEGRIWTTTRTRLRNFYNGEKGAPPSDNAA